MGIFTAKSYPNHIFLLNATQRELPDLRRKHFIGRKKLPDVKRKHAHMLPLTANKTLEAF